MVNGVILLVDAAEGPMPQTRFVLQKALELGHKVIVAVNKVDKPDARVHEVMDEVLELLLDLNATDEQFNSPTVFCSGRQGTASLRSRRSRHRPDAAVRDHHPLYPRPHGRRERPLQLLVSAPLTIMTMWAGSPSAVWSRVPSKVNQEVTICDYHDPSLRQKGKVVALYKFDGLAKVPVQSASAGEIVALSGISDITIGRTPVRPRCGGGPALRENQRPHH